MRYRTIVADPPWHYKDWPVSRIYRGAEHDGRRTPIKYPTMAVAEIAEAWGFRFCQILVWAKTPMGIGPGGAFAQNAEFVPFCRKGSPGQKKRVDSVWFNWPRMGAAHSRKPEAFLDLVEQVSPGPYLELFARRQRLGWDTWGDEALNHVELPA